MVKQYELNYSQYFQDDFEKLIEKLTRNLRLIFAQKSDWMSRWKNGSTDKDGWHSGFTIS